MVFRKKTWLLVLFLLTLVCAIAFQIFQISKTENLYPMSILQKGYEIKTENLYPIQFWMRGDRSGYAYVIALFNLLPIPPLDGYQIFSVWLPPKLQDRNGIASIIGLFFICFLLPFIPRAAFPIFESANAVMLALGISKEFSLGGWYLLERWYTALPLLLASLVYLIYKPASIFQLAGLILEIFLPEAALKMYDSAIKIDPKSALSWERQGWTLQRLQPTYVEIIPVWEEAIKLNPHNRLLRRMLILKLRLAFIYDRSYEQQLIEARKQPTLDRLSGTSGA